MSDKQARKYFENMPYGNDAKSSEIHGKQNQQVINKMVAELVARYDEAMALGEKDLASNYSGAIKQIAADLDNLKEEDLDDNNTFTFSRINYPPLEFKDIMKFLEWKCDEEQIWDGYC